MDLLRSQCGKKSHQKLTISGKHMSLPDALLIPENKNSFADNDEEKRMAGSELENDRAKNDSSNLRRRSVLELGVLFMAAIALGNVLVLRRKLFTIASSYKPGEYGNSSRRKWDGSTHSTDGGRSTRTQRVWPEHLEDEMRKERIRRMQEAFYREKMRYAGSYEKWHDQRHAGWNARNDWEKKTREDRGTGTGNDSHVLKRPGLLHHYQVLGLDAKRHSSYSEAEIKAAFRARAMEHHPDRNMSRKEESELKFKEVLEAYDALRAWHRSKT